jgi:GTPase
LLAHYIRENAIFLQASINNETTKNGLIILEAYYGLHEHVYQIDSGLLIFKHPKTIVEYYDAQIIPVKKKLQLMVQNS